MTQEQKDKIIALVKRCKADFLFLAKHFLKVEARVGGKLIPFEMNGPQKVLHVIVEKHIKPNRPVRIVALKARRMGFSTYFSARFFWKSAFYRNRKAAQITHEPEATDTLFKMVKRMYDHLPKWMQPEQKYNNKALLEFNNKEGNGLNSGFRVATAGKSDFGSGQSIHFLHLSELSKWAAETTSSLLTSVEQTVPFDDPEAELVIESTAKGMGGAFYSRFYGARYRIWVKRLKEGKPVLETSINTSAEEDNQFTSIFLPWFVFEDYIMPVPKTFSKTQEEVEMATRFGLSDEQLVWRRFAIANLCDGDIDKFNQEYPDCPEVAFLTSGRPVFDNVKIAAYKDAAPKPIARYEFEINPEGGSGFGKTTTGRLAVWEEPDATKAYIIGADVAEGLEKGDFSCAYVIDHRTGEMVAEWHGKCDPDHLAKVLYALGMRYNTAILAPERNNHGYTVISWLQNVLLYPPNKIYVEMVHDPPAKPYKRYGWVTTTTSRPIVLDNLIREARDGIHGIKSAALFEEMLSFKIQKNGKMEADADMHDDRVMAYAIAKYVKHTIPLRIRQQRMKSTVSTGSIRGSSAGWRAFV